MNNTKKMKNNLKTILCLLLIIGVSTSSDAQLFKKLKRKIDRKLERKVDEKIDEEIDEAFEGEKEKEVKTAGSVILRHDNSYGAITIEEITNPVVERNDKGYWVNTSWRTHEVDIFDGLSLQINTDKNIRHDENESGERLVFRIPEEASLSIGYDPELPYYSQSKDDFRRGVSDAYQNFDFLKGEVVIDVLDANNIQISFSGKGKLRKVTRSPKDNTTKETFYITSLVGAVDAVQPRFRNNLTGTEEEGEEAVTSWDDMVPEETNTNATEPGVYNFTFQTDVLVTVPEENQSFKLSYLLNPNANYSAIKANLSDYDASTEGTSLIVVDGDDSHIFVETSGMKIRMSQNMMQGQQAANPSEQMANYDYTRIQKTGKTKSILGATCHEYTMHDEEVQMVLWIAPEIKLPNWFIQNPAYIDGHIMEYTVTSKEGTMNSKVTAIHDHIRVTVNAADYKKMF